MNRLTSCSRLLSAVFLIAISFFTQSVWSQSDPPLDTVKENETKIYEQTIYVPYEKLHETFERTGRGVYLPYEKFQELWKAARESKTAPQPPSAPPSKAIVTEIRSEATIEQDVMKVSSIVSIDLLETGWIDVPLSLRDTAILSAELEGEPAKLITNSDGSQHLVYHNTNQESTTIQLRLVYAQSYEKKPGQNSVTFQPPVSPVHRWQVKIPEQDTKVKVFPMLAATELTGFSTNNINSDADSEGSADVGKESGTEEITEIPSTTVLAFVGATPTVRIEWTPKSEGASGLEALVNVNGQTRVTVSANTVRTQSKLSYQISRSELRQLRVYVPADHRVVDVVDPNIRGWSVAATDEGQEITVDLFQAADEVQSLQVELEQFRSQDKDQASASEWSPAKVRAIGVGRQRGVVLVQLSSDLRAETIRRTGISQLDQTDLDASDRSNNWTFAFGYANLEYDLAFRIEQVEPVITVEQFVEVYLDSRQLSVRLIALFDIQRTGVFELLLQIPEDYEIRQIVGVSGPQGQTAVQVDSYRRDSVNPSLVAVNLSTKAIGAVALTAYIEKTLDDANLVAPTGQSVALGLPSLKVADAGFASSIGTLTLYAPEGLRVRANQLVGLRAAAIDANAVSGLMPKPSGLRPIQSYSFASGDYVAQLEVTRRQPQVIATQLLVARFEPGVVQFESTIIYQIRYSSIEILRLDVPVDIADSLRTEGGDLRDQEMSPQPDDVAAGYVAWSLVGEAELLGSHQIKLAWETPLDELSVGASIELDVPRILPQSVDRASGQIVLVKAETIDIAPSGTPLGLNPIDPRFDLENEVQIPDASAALEFQDDWALALKVTRYQLESLKQTSVELALIRSVVTRNDRVSIQALYRMRSNQQRLEFSLPGQATNQYMQLDTQPVRINGRPVSLEKGENQKTYFVPLVGHNGNEPFVLEIRYSVAGNASKLEYPLFPNEPASQKTAMLVYLPRDTTLVRYGGPWTDEFTWRSNRGGERMPDLATRVDQIFKRITEGISISGDPKKDFSVDGKPHLFTTLRTPNDGTGSLAMTVVPERTFFGAMFAVVLILGLLLMRTQWSVRIVVVFAFVGVALMLGVFWPSLVSHAMDRTIMMASVLVGLAWFVAEIPSGLDWLRRLVASWRTRVDSPSATDQVHCEMESGSDDAVDTSKRPSEDANSHDGNQEGQQ